MLSDYEHGWEVRPSSIPDFCHVRGTLLFCASVPSFVK